MRLGRFDDPWVRLFNQFAARESPAERKASRRLVKAPLCLLSTH
jgi:hypothetical protein